MLQKNNHEKKTNQTKKKIIMIAEDFFSRFNYSSVTMEDIAHKLKITKPALYYHFKGKEELFMEMVKEIFDEFGEELDHILKKDISLEEKFKELCLTYINFSLSKKDIGRFMAQKFSRKDKNILKLMRKFKNKMINRLEPLIAEVLVCSDQNEMVDSKFATFFLIGALNISIAHKLTEKNDDWKTEKIVEQIFALFFKNNY